MKIQSTLEFIQWKYKNFDAGNRAQLFRGQLDSSWQLLPSIVRYAEKLSESFDSIAQLERHLIEWFQKYSMPFRDYRPIPYVEKLVHGQHYGLPTRLLDWTTNPLKALYFSVENPEFDAVDGMVYEFSPEGWSEAIGSVNIDTALAAFMPELLNERLGAQEGCFTSFPLPQTSFIVLPLTKENYPDVYHISSVQIDSKCKRQIRLELNELGINHRTIYPGLEGVAKWIKSELSSFTV